MRHRFDFRNAADAYEMAAYWRLTEGTSISAADAFKRMTGRRFAGYNAYDQEAYVLPRDLRDKVQDARRRGLLDV